MPGNNLFKGSLVSGLSIWAGFTFFGAQNVDQGMSFANIGPGLLALHNIMNNHDPVAGFMNMNVGFFIGFLGAIAHSEMGLSSEVSLLAAAAVVAFITFLMTTANGNNNRQALPAHR